MKQKPKVTPVATHCGHCGKPLAEDRHWKTQYCCPSHRVMASASRSSAELKLVTKQRDELLVALEVAKEALEGCYDVNEWPASGDSSCDKAIATVEIVIAKVKGETA